jgi:hypothetical protein
MLGEDEDQCGEVREERLHEEVADSAGWGQVPRARYDADNREPEHDPGSEECRLDQGVAER